jgi:regulator of protease activity HflC (stomatin/prohibitin superfamily)
MKALKLGLVGLAVLAGLFFVGLKASITQVGVNQIGVRVNNYGILGSQGVDPVDYEPGWHMDLGPLHRWVLYDRTVQTLEMTNARLEEAWKYRTSPVKPRTSDGYALTVDVTVKYRIKPGEAHQLYERFGASADRYHQQVRQKAEGSIRDVFGDLRAEDFYNPFLKRDRAELARVQLQKDLDDSYLEIVAVLIRDVTFPSEYEQRILAKKIADQDKEVQKSKKLAKDAEIAADMVVAETEAQVGLVRRQLEAEKSRRKADVERRIAEILATAEAEAIETRADADLYRAKLRADALRLQKEAEAEGARLKNEALAGDGGRALVALEAVKNLELGRAEFPTSQVDFLDVDAMLRKLGMPIVGGGGEGE